MAANGPPHDWIESDVPDTPDAPDAPDADEFQEELAPIVETVRLMDQDPPWDVDDEGIIVARGSAMDAQRFGVFDWMHADGEPRYYVIPYGTPVTQALGETCVGHVPCQANRFYLSVAEGVPVPHEDRGAIRVRHLPRQARSLHRWRPVPQERFDALVAARYATHPDESLVAAMRSVVGGLTERHTRFRNNPSPREVARRNRDAGSALQFRPPPIALPSPLLRSLIPPPDPDAVPDPDEAEEYDFSWARRPRALRHRVLDDGERVGRTMLSPAVSPSAATVGALRRLVEQVRAETASAAAVPAPAVPQGAEVDDYGYVLSPRHTPPVPQSTREAIMRSLSSAFEALDATPMDHYHEGRIPEELLTDAFTIRRPGRRGAETDRGELIYAQL